MTPGEKKALEDHLETLLDFQDEMFKKGHTYWHCDSSDYNERMDEYLPFRYYQTHRSKNMSTCGTCYRLMENKLKIRAIQKKLGLPVQPLRTRIASEEKIHHMSISDTSEWNPNYRYLK